MFQSKHSEESQVQRVRCCKYDWKRAGKDAQEPHSLLLGRSAMIISRQVEILIG